VGVWKSGGVKIISFQCIFVVKIKKLQFVVLHWTYDWGCINVKTNRWLRNDPTPPKKKVRHNNLINTQCVILNHNITVFIVRYG